MSFRNLDGETLAKVVDFFAVDVVAADPEKGASKKELLAALAAGDEPVTWEQYQTIYLPALAEVEPEVVVEPVVTQEAVVVEKPVEPEIVLKMDRMNPTYEVRGYKFTQEHPFRPVRQSDAEFILKTLEGFRIAMPSEVAEYYN